MWFILNFVPKTASLRASLPAMVEAYSKVVKREIELFAPTFVSLTSENGKVSKKEKPLLYHYIFVKGDAETIMKMCQSFDGFSFVLDHTGKSRHLTIDDYTLEQFRTIAQYYGNKLPCYPLEGIKLEEGDKIQIVSGPCAGLKGTYISKKGGKSGNVLVAVDHNMAVVVYDVKAEYVRVLEFARDSRRVYDQIDSFTSRLLGILRAGYRETDISGRDRTKDIATLSVFVSRMDSVKLNNPKLEAKLQILLYSACRLLGERGKAEQALEKYNALSHHITNPWTQALVLVLKGRKAEASALVDQYKGTKLSALQQRILDLIQ